LRSGIVVSWLTNTGAIEQTACRAVIAGAQLRTARGDLG